MHSCWPRHSSCGQTATYVKAMLSIWVIMLPVVMVCVIALGMAVCSSSCSATQFAIYMSVANLGHSAGSKIFGMVAEQTTWTESYMLMGVLVIVMIVVLLFHRHQHDAGSGRRQKREPHVHRQVQLPAGVFSGRAPCAAPSAGPIWSR